MIDIGQLRELEPYIEKAHNLHDAKSNSPLDPINELRLASGSSDEASVIDIFQNVNKNALAHFKKLDLLKVDYSSVLAASFLVNLLTEDNLPHYTKTIDRVAQDSEAFSSWLNRWTAEEHSHGVILRDYAVSSGIIGNSNSKLIPHQTYHDGVSSQLLNGTEITIESLAGGFAYLSFQEGLTKVAHRNEQFLLDSTGRRVVKRVAADEAGHESFYAYLQSIMFKLHPDESLIATDVVRRRFAMPGQIGIPNYINLAKRIAIAGIFNADMTRKVQDAHLHGEQWNIESLKPVTEAGKIAQEKLLGENKLLIRLQKMTDIDQDKEIKVAKESEVEGQLLPFIIGKTVKINETTKEITPIAA